jgi:hypothetical protein
MEKYSVIIGFNEDTQYSIIIEKYNFISGQKQVIESIIESDLTLEECLTIQNDFIK